MALFSRKKEEDVAKAKNTKSSDATKTKKKKKVTALSVFAHVLLSPVVTEKAYTLSEKGKYVFRVHTRATKAQVQKAVSDIFGVDVVKVNMTVKKKQNTSFRGISGKTKTQKKAIVTVKEGQKIDLFE